MQGINLRCLRLKAKNAALRFGSAAFGCSGLVSRSGHRVFGMIGVPQRHKFIGGLADIFAMDDRAGKDVAGVQAVLDGPVETVLDAERAVQVNAGQVGAQPCELDAAPGGVEEDDRVAQLADDQGDHAAVQVGAVSNVADKLVVLNGVAQVNAWTIGANCRNSSCHF